MTTINTSDRSELRNLLSDVEKQKLVIKSANDSIKDARARAKKDFGISLKNFNRLIEIRTKQNLDSTRQELDEAEQLYQDIYGSSS